MRKITSSDDSARLSKYVYPIIGAQPQSAFEGRNGLELVERVRATFVTVALATGRTETWVRDRTGHCSSEMVDEYRRQARTHKEACLGPLASLHEAIPELAAVQPQARGRSTATPSVVGQAQRRDDVHRRSPSAR